MADDIRMVNGVPRRYNPKRTVGQAIGDAVSAAARYVAPHSVTDIKPRTDQAVDDAQRLRSNQGTDRHNGY